jgi:hypothetical protein
VTGWKWDLDGDDRLFAPEEVWEVIVAVDEDAEMEVSEVLVLLLPLPTEDEAALCSEDEDEDAVWPFCITECVDADPLVVLPLPPPPLLLRT